MAKGGSKLLTGIISFILGFLFAIIVECGAVFGVYWFVMNKDIDTVLSAIGIENKDENGNDKYINTDPNNGGARKTLYYIQAQKSKRLRAYTLRARACFINRSFSLGTLPVTHSQSKKSSVFAVSSGHIPAPINSSPLTASCFIVSGKPAESISE